MGRAALWRVPSDRGRTSPSLSLSPATRRTVARRERFPRAPGALHTEPSPSNTPTKPETGRRVCTLAAGRGDRHLQSGREADVPPAPAPRQTSGPLGGGVGGGSAPGFQGGRTGRRGRSAQ